MAQPAALSPEVDQHDHGNRPQNAVDEQWPIFDQQLIWRAAETLNVYQIQIARQHVKDEGDGQEHL